MDRVVQAALRIRTHRHLALVAAAVLVGMVSVAAVYALAPFAMGFIVSGTVAVSHALVWLVTSAAEARAVVD